MFYTYILIDPRDDAVFYVGKGKGNRCYQHLANAGKVIGTNRKLKNKILKIIGIGLTPFAEKIFEHQDEWPALANEIAAISFYGRENLCNLTDGGEGIANPSQELRAQMSARLIGNKHRLGIPHSPEIRAKMSAARQSQPKGEAHYMFGRKASLESRAKMSESHKGDRSFWFGKHLSEESKAKLAAHNTGKKASLEARAKMSIA